MTPSGVSKPHRRILGDEIFLEVSNCEGVIKKFKRTKITQESENRYKRQKSSPYYEQKT